MQVQDREGANRMPGGNVYSSATRRRASRKRGHRLGTAGRPQGGDPREILRPSFGCRIKLFFSLDATVLLAMVLDFPCCGVEGEDFHGIVEARVLWPEPIEPSPSNFTGTGGDTCIADD